MIAIHKKKARNCGKCDTVKNLTLHHILPKRWFQNSLKITLCRHCHDKLEVLIHEKERVNRGTLSVCEYFNLAIGFVLVETRDLENEPLILDSYTLVLDNPESVKRKNGQLTIFLKKSIDYLSDLNISNVCFFQDILFL